MQCNLRLTFRYASGSQKKMAKEFLQNVEKDSKSYHKSWARKFGNKYQSAKNWVKRDKKMVAMDIAQKGVKTGIGMIPFPGSKEGAALLEVAGGAALKAASRKAWEEGSKKGVKSLLNKSSSRVVLSTIGFLESFTYDSFLVSAISIW